MGLNIQLSPLNLKTIIFQRSKKYVSLTRVNRLKVAPNMADLINLNENRL